MKTPIIARAAALVASIVVSFSTVQLIAEYALPESPAIELAQATPRG